MTGSVFSAYVKFKARKCEPGENGAKDITEGDTLREQKGEGRQSRGEKERKV